MNRKGFTIIEVMIVLVIGGILAVLIFPKLLNLYNRNAERYAKQFTDMGYNINDVRAFSRYTDIEIDDLLRSPALRKQLDKFIAGETTAFIQQARDKKNSDDARASGMATGAAMGLVLGSSMRR